jgi:SAM-dependent methyltransferase
MEPKLSPDEISQPVAPAMPKVTDQGMIPTLNNKGFMTTSLDPVSTAFTVYAGQVDGWCLDLGCAYGIATLAALENGAKIVACDMEQGHIDVLLSKVGDAAKDRIKGSVGVMPDVTFEDQSFAAILCSRALHFLNGQDVEKTVTAMGHWLQPGGKVFLVADTPYTGFWARGAKAYEQRKAEGDPWPGFIPDVTVYLPETSPTKNIMRYLNPMDPDILARVCTDAGLVMEQAAFSGRPDRNFANAHAGVIARRSDENAS